MTSPRQVDWTLLLRACHAVNLKSISSGTASSVAPGEQEERITNSKLDRLAEELRALGIQF